MRAWGVVLATGLALLAPAGASAAPHHGRAEQWSEFTLSGSHGYRINVIATPAGKGRNVFVTAAKREGEVEYAAHGIVGRSGSIHAGLADVGLISAHFVPGRVKRRAAPHQCRGGGEVVRYGHFRGVIELHGDRGFTSIRTHDAPGTVTTSFRSVCHEPSGGGGTPTAQILAGSRNIRFSAYRTPFGSGEQLTYFTASATSSRHGLLIRSFASVGGEDSQLSVSPPSGTPAAGSVAPPPPFQGSATFQLTSPTTASWEGSLSVVLPGFGPVPLTGAGFWSAACNGRACTDTAPGGVKLAPVGF